MSALLVVAVIAGVLVLGLLVLGAALLGALRTTGESVAALERRLADVEEQSGLVRDALSSVDGDLAEMTAQLTNDRDSLTGDPTSDTTMQGRTG